MREKYSVAWPKIASRFSALHTCTGSSSCFSPLGLVSHTCFNCGDDSIFFLIKCYVNVQNFLTIVNPEHKRRVEHVMNMSMIWIESRKIIFFKLLFKFLFLDREMKIVLKILFRWELHDATLLMFEVYLLFFRILFLSHYVFRSKNWYRSIRSLSSTPEAAKVDCNLYFLSRERFRCLIAYGEKSFLSFLTESNTILSLTIMSNNNGEKKVRRYTFATHKYRRNHWLSLKWFPRQEINFL